MQHDLVGVFADRNPRDHVQIAGAHGQHGATGPVRHKQERPVVRANNIVGPPAAFRRLRDLAAGHFDGVDAAGIDIERIERVRGRIEQEPTAKMMQAGPLLSAPSAVPPARGRFSRRLLGLKRGVEGFTCQPLVVHRVLEDAIAAASRPPDEVLPGRRREAEPTFAYALAGQFLLGAQIDQRQLVAVVAVSADEGAAIVG